MLDAKDYHFKGTTSSALNKELNGFIESLFQKSYEFKEQGGDFEEFTKAKTKIVSQIIDDYIRISGNEPNDNILERLGTLLLFQEFTDLDPHKSQKGYSFQSPSQERNRTKKNVMLASVEFGESRGLYKKINHSTEVDNNQSTRETLIFDWVDENPTDLQVDLYRIIEKAKLTEIQMSTIIDVYFNDKSLSQIAKEQGIHQKSVYDRLQGTLKKLRETEGSSSLQQYLK